MPPVAAGGGRGQANVNSAATPARTTLSIDPGNPSAKLEDAFQLPSTSPVVSSWSFINWIVDGVNLLASAPRSVVGNPILMATRRPTALEQTNLDGLSFLAHELDHDESSIWLHEMDKVHAFDKTYATLGD